MEKPNLV